LLSSRGFQYSRPYAPPIAAYHPSRTFNCKCGTTVTTTAKNKYQCDKCQLEQNREAARRASRRQTQKNKTKSTGVLGFRLQLPSDGDREKRGGG
jgi:hypothetical protein